ncbi:MAG: hypothetical protein E4H24_07410 [Thermomicrobiales bacterium]|jgi:hypothetical protein|nr:MAG: hypothetical protein E4H24_07410 [Thermomicrobiales bacterium]
MCIYSERTQVLLSPEQLARLKRIAARDGKSVGAEMARLAWIISPDLGFDQVAEVRRIDPTAFGADPA